VLNHIKGEIVKAGETPYANDKQQKDFQARVLQHEQQPRKQAAEQEHESLRVNQSRVFYVGHG
jgi:hypothetical protein